MVDEDEEGRLVDVLSVDADGEEVLARDGPAVGHRVRPVLLCSGGEGVSRAVARPQQSSEGAKPKEHGAS